MLASRCDALAALPLQIQQLLFQLASLLWHCQRVCSLFLGIWPHEHVKQSLSLCMHQAVPPLLAPLLPPLSCLVIYVCQLVCASASGMTQACCDSCWMRYWWTHMLSMGGSSKQPCMLLPNQVISFLPSLLKLLDVLWHLSHLCNIVLSACNFLVVHNMQCLDRMLSMCLHTPC